MHTITAWAHGGMGAGLCTWGLQPVARVATAWAHGGCSLWCVWLQPGHMGAAACGACGYSLGTLGLQPVVRVARAELPEAHCRWYE